MADSSRLDELRRRVEKDPASIAFAQLAEEYRRAGLLEQAVEVCHAGLKIHPGYLSARVTLGRALIELNQLQNAQQELEQVLRSAPENLAAIRGLAEIYHREGHLPEALTQYRAALAIARNDPDLERTVDELAHKVAPQPRSQPADGMSFEQMHQALFTNAPAPPPRAEAPAEPPATSPVTAPPVAPAAAPQYNPPPTPADDRAHRTIAALTGWLDALNVARTDSRP